MAAERRERAFSVRVCQEISHIFTVFSKKKEKKEEENKKQNKNGLVGIFTQ